MIRLGYVHTGFYTIASILLAAILLPDAVCVSPHDSRLEAGYLIGRAVEEFG